MVDVGVSELRRNRDRLGAAAETEPDSTVGALNLFYAVECGLKAAVLRSVLCRGDTSALPADLRTHNLRRLAKELRLQPPSGTDPLRCRRHRDGSWVECHELHEAWRYGAVLRSEDQKAATESLKELLLHSRRLG